MLAVGVAHHSNSVGALIGPIPGLRVALYSLLSLSCSLFAYLSSHLRIPEPVAHFLHFSLLLFRGKPPGGKVLPVVSRPRSNAMQWRWRPEGVAEMVVHNHCTACSPLFPISFSNSLFCSSVMQSRHSLQ